MDAIWKKETELPQFEPLRGDVKTDVLIIGGGAAGLLCAWMLKEAGVSCLLAEEKSICSGITGRTTAKITAQHGLIYSKLLRRFGHERAKMYLRANLEALERFRTLAEEIDCDFEICTSAVYTQTAPEKVEQELKALQKLGYPAGFASELKLPVAIQGAVVFEHQAQFHPLKFFAALAPKLNICENTKILELKPGLAVTNRGKIYAEHIIVATHFPFLNKHGGYFLKLYQHRSYVLALKNADRVDGMYVDEQDDGLSFRSHGNLLLLGGGGHRTGKRGGSWRELEAFARRAYPKAGEVCRWAAQDCMSLDGVPYIGPYSPHTPGLFVATGFNKWGMTSAMVSAMILTEAVQGREHLYAPVFSPSRTVLRPQLAVNAAESALNLLTPTAPRCPHLGCALKYNPQEHSWDCPCHGSRFDAEGKLLDNPATGDLREKQLP